MVKVHKIFSIDQDLIEELKKVNASGLVNDLLNQHFNNTSQLTKEVLKQQASELRRKIFDMKEQLNAVEDKLEQIKAAEREIRDTLDNIPQFIIDDFNAFPDMSADVLETRYREIYSQKTRLTLDDVSKALEIFKNEA